MFDARHTETPTPVACTLRAPVARIDRRLDALTGSVLAQMPPVHTAMRHALLAPGKRLRPLFVLLIGGDGAGTLDAACAIEMVHAASLILDDMPCMDDAALRRGRATTHRAFGEARAVLASVALIAQAFETLATLPVPPKVRAALAAVLAEAIGRDGMAAGQDMDIADEAGGARDVERVNGLKTAGLFAAAVRMGTILGDRTPEQSASLDLFAWHFGCAFQIADDRLDGHATPCDSGKDVGRDDGKATLGTLVGQSEAWAVRLQHVLRAKTALEQAALGKAALESFSALADRITAP